MRGNSRILAVAVFLLVIAAIGVESPRAMASIVLDKAFPVQNETIRIHLSDLEGPVGDANVTVTYRPGSAVPKTDEVGTTGGDGSLEWIPNEAGIATVSATWMDLDNSEQTASLNVSVKYQSAPVDGIVIMVVAGILLIIGSLVRMIALLREPWPE